MNIAVRDASLLGLIDRASNALLGARTSAEVLEARDMATVAYTAAKVAARFGKAKNAHDKLIAAAHRAQADALEIEAGAKRRLADEYDAAQDRGEVATRADQNLLPNEKKVSAKDIGLTHKDIHEARKIRDAEEREPGIIRSALDAMLKQGRGPSRADLRRAIMDEEDDTDEIVPVTAAEKRVAFMVFSNEAMLLAKYDGPIDEEVVSAAKATASAWCRLVETMEQGE